jgi:chemotaxis signal transduction protein
MWDEALPRPSVAQPVSSPAPTPVDFAVALIGGRRFALAMAAIERILRMAALTPLPAAPAHVAGLLNLQGAALPVVDPRPLLGLPRSRPRPDQQLVVLSGAPRHALWVDRVEQIVSAVPSTVDDATADAPLAVAPAAILVGAELIPVLSVAALAPVPRAAVTWAGDR